MHKRTDISLRGLALGAAIVFGGIAASLLAAGLIARHAAGPNQGEPVKVEGPPLQTAPADDLRAFLREKNARLHGSGPVDADHVHIPIERAMEILANGRER
jgi:hypothetical protein